MLYFKFTTRDGGVPATLGGSPVISVYKDASTTQSVAGVTLTVDFDAVTGLNHVTIDTSADATFYANGHHFELVITTGTVGGTSVVGEDVGQFDLAAASTALTLQQIVNAILDEVNTGATHNVNNSVGKQIRTSGGGNTSAIYTGTAPTQGGMTSTQIKLDSGASSVSQVYRYNVISILSGTDAGDSAVVIDYNGSTKIATVDEAWAVQPDNTSVFEITPGAKALVIDKTGFSLSATGLAALPAGAMNGLGDWLTTLGPTAPTGWITSSVVAANALVGKGDWLTASDGRLNNLDAAISTRSTYAGGPVASVTAPVTLPSIPSSWITAAGIAAGALDGKGNWSTLTDAQAADKILGRSIDGGADGGRTVAQALAFLRNRWTISGGTLIVYATDDSATLWTAAVATSAGNPVTGIDPA